MIGYAAALDRILKNSASLRTEKLPLASLHKRVAGVDVVSPIHLPSFRNSAMDGFAVSSSDLANAAREHPVTITIACDIAAGDEIKHMDAASGAAQIMTGALVPEIYDAVIKLEDVMVDGGLVTFRHPAKPGENIRFAGEDVKSGQVVVSNGRIINSEQIMMLAALGIAELEVYSLPDIHVISTGNEITDHLSTPLPDGKIYNASAPYLISCLKEAGINANYDGIVADDAAVFEQKVTSVKDGSIIITTGAVSKGKWDFIPASLQRLGAKMHFHGVNIRPGKPILFATLPNGNWFFGLPGNPISTAVGFRFFVLPLIRALQKLAPEQPVQARLEKDFIKKGHFRQFLPSSLIINANGELTVAIASGQEVCKISPMTESNSWVILDEDGLEYQAGALVPVIPFATGSFLCHRT